MKRFLLVAGLALTTAMTTVVADDKAIEALQDKLANLIPGEAPDSVRESALKGMYEVTYGAQIIYLSEDGKYLLQGDLVDVETRKNLTVEATRLGRAKLMESLSEDETIVFAPKGETKHTITVFTDIDCGYCRKLHNEMADYNKEGIKVQYLLYPRAGLNSPSYDKAVTAWCADDQHDTLTALKNQKKVANKTCENPVKDHLDLGRQVGVTGTPAIVLSDGTLVPGYRPAKDLAMALDAIDL